MLITTMGPYEIHYCVERKEFDVCEPGNLSEPLFSHEAQRAAEDAALKLMKKIPGLPMAVYKGGMSQLYRGRITSVNLDTGEMWFSYDEHEKFHSREKLYRGQMVYSVCDTNEAVDAELRRIAAEMKALEQQRFAAEKRLVGPITAERFYSKKEA